MGNFAIMRWGKIKFDGVSNAEYHQRTELHKNCEHPELREQNFTFRPFEDETLRQTTKRLRAAQQERTGRAVRKDATVMVDFVLTFSPEMVGKVDMGAWFKANVDWFHFAVFNLCPPCVTSLKSESLHCLCITVLHGNQLRDVLHMLFEIKIALFIKRRYKCMEVWG